MIDSKTREKYKSTIGIECHVQLKTKTKLFAAVGNDAREVPPNTLVSHICFGLPGALPVLNKEAIFLASKAAFALNSTPQKFSKFDRKHYFYPDLPMGYQITQYEEPIILGGEVEIDIDGKKKIIGITRAHLESDAGKSVHPPGADYSLVDLNRAGTPLLEIVSEPDIKTAAEAKAYAKELYLRMRYADVSDANLFYGNMRFDVNVSVSQTDEFGTRTESKNLNSFKAVEKAVEYEIDRQIDVIEKGGHIVQETRGWDDSKQKTFSQRTKENADDYRYMPDPDIPPVILEDDYINKIRNLMPVMPEEWRSRLKELGVDQNTVNLMIEIQAEASEFKYLEFIETKIADKNFAKWVTNIFVNTIEPLRLNSDKFVKHDWNKLEEIFNLVGSGKLSSSRSKDLITDIFTNGTIPENLESFAAQKGYIQVSDENEINKIVAQVLSENEKAKLDVKNGEMKAIEFLVGQVMKLSKGKANPTLAQRAIIKIINESK